jgi:large subunit ribosomal protein L15
VVSLNSIHPGVGARKNAKRLGRGQGSGQGCTAGRGYNGAGARSGTSGKAYFEGGQTPLTRRIGKRGFVHALRVEYQIVNLEQIAKLLGSEKEIDAQWMCIKGLIRSADGLVKVLGNGDIAKSVTIKADAFSASAREKIEKAKGKVEGNSRA